MNGADAFTAVPGGPVPVRPRSARVFISYAHEPESEGMAAALVRVLRAHGCDVSTDHDSQLRNPTSVPAWMDDEIASRVVLCVLSLEYLRAFAEPVTEAAPRKGVRYELRVIRQRIYDHEGRYGCPVIPVATPDLQLEHVAPTLRALDISRFDPETGYGTDQLLARIAAVDGMGGNGAMSLQDQMPQGSSRRVFRQVVYDLEDDRPAEEAIELVRKCLELAENPELHSDFVLAFPVMAEVIKDHGQVDLMRTLTAACLRNLEIHGPRLRSERVVEAQVLICGAAWYLQRDHHLHEALEAAQKGIELAERHEIRRIAAFGRQSVGRIQRLLAEDARGQDCDYHLTASARSLRAALALFSAIDGPRVRRSEVGICLDLSARTELVRYRLLGEKAALEHADELAQQAGELLTPEQKWDTVDLMILKAEIVAANRRYADARRLLGDVVESLIAERGARRSELLACAYLARARVTLASRGARSDLMPDLRKARAIFRGQHLTHAAASAAWLMLTTDSRSVTPLKITSDDTQQLETLAADPRVRLDAIAELERHVDAGRINHPAGRRINWAGLVNEVRRRYE